VAVAQLLPDPINQNDVNEYLQTSADFSFEMKVLAWLKAKGFSCEHSGSYTDPVTAKTREFDIRAEKDIGRWRMRLAIECKNLRDNYPLVVHAVPRAAADSWHWVILHRSERLQAGMIKMSEATDTETPFQAVKFSADKTPYKSGAWVSKSIDQVGRGTTRKIVTGSEQVYDKVSQAINSAQELVAKSHQGAFAGGTVIVPILVIAPGTLWEAQYDEHGALQGVANQVAHASYFIDRSWPASETRNQHYRISHLEICTFDHLEVFFDERFLGDTPTMLPKLP
jgi:hypothetical protein